MTSFPRKPEPKPWWKKLLQKPDFQFFCFVIFCFVLAAITIGVRQ